jgi:hypothetical protein
MRMVLYLSTNNKDILLDEKSFIPEKLAKAMAREVSFQRKGLVKLVLSKKDVHRTLVYDNGSLTPESREVMGLGLTQVA